VANELALNVLLNARNNTGGAFSSLLGGFAKIPPVAAAAGIALLGVGLGVAVDKAAKFQSGLTTLVTGAGESANNLKMVGQGILDMSVKTATSTDQLTSGMFMIESAGYHGANGLKVLQAAAMGAKVGNADLGVTADATTTILKDYNMSTDQATQAVNGLIATVANGKTHMEDLAGSLSQILPTASAARIRLNDVEGAMATMTGEGVPAANAATYLRQTILALNAPSAAAVKTLKSVGLTTQEVSTEMQRSLPDALKMITDAVGKKFPVGSAAYIAALKNISGGSKTMQGMLDLTGSHLKDFQANVTNVTQSVKQGGNSITGWSDVQKTFNFQMDAAKAAVNAAFIQIGEKLLPVLTRLLSAVTPLITKFADWVSTLHANSPVLVIFGAALAGLATIVIASVVPAIWAMVGSLFAISAPVLIAAAVVTAVVAVIILAFQHWGQMMDWITGKAEQMRLKNEEAHVKMKIAADENTAAQAKHAIANIEKERQGILEKLKNCHSESERRELEHQLKMLNAQQKGQEERLVAAEKDKQNQLAKQKKLHDDMLEAQKWFGQRFLDMIGSWIGDQMSKLGTMVHGWVDKLGQLKDQAVQKAQDIINGIKNWFEQLPGMALKWGENLISGFINGIKNMAGGVGQAVSGIVGGIKNFLGFHSPAKEGPGATADQWSPAFMKMYIQGFRNNIPELRTMLNEVASELSSALEHPATRHRATHHPATHHRATHHAGFKPVDVTSALNNSGGVGTGSSLSNAGIVVINNITINAPNTSAQDIVNLVLKRITFDNRRRGNFVTATSGGRI
jgi:TP901 family phage tail tape measure protein